MATIPNKSTFDQWNEGDIPDNTAIDELTRQYSSLQDRLEPLNQQKELLRNQLSQVVEKVGGRSNVNGYKLAITKPTLIESYDKKSLDQLLESLLAKGDTETADAIQNCKKTSPRAGGLQISQEKERPAE